MRRDGRKNVLISFDESDSAQKNPERIRPNDDPKILSVAIH